MTYAAWDADMMFAPDIHARCPTCAEMLQYVHEYPPDIVPNGQRISGQAASYVFRCPSDGLWHVFGNGKIMRYALPTPLGAATSAPTSAKA